ncbi:MAG: YchJ family protein [Spirosomaceae bacterium]|jgi:SEC-C motif-containing protein|nr:YchJ family protein [Spirosomataceae bacterium]
MCYCGDLRPFSNCCEPIIKGDKTAHTAEELMRSRYSAYVVVDVEYLVKTSHLSQRKNFNRTDIRAWAVANEWQKLEVINTKKGLLDDNDGEVEFKAYFLDENRKQQIHHEKSTFIRENGKWFYLSGINSSKSLPQNVQNRNDLCACGSGKKFKKCCGRN